MSQDLQSVLFKWGISALGALLLISVARLYQTLDNQAEVIAAIRERDVAMSGEIAVIQARLNGIDAANLVRLEGNKIRLDAIEQRLDRVQQALEKLHNDVHSR